MPEKKRNLGKVPRIRCVNCDWSKMTKKQKAEVAALIKMLEERALTKRSP